MQARPTTTANDSDDEDDEGSELLYETDNDDDDADLLHDNRQQAETPEKRADADAAADDQVMERLRPPGSTTSTTMRLMVLDVIIQRSPKRQATEALLIGRMADGASGCLVVRGWCPHLLVRAPQGWVDGPEQRAGLRLQLHEKLETHLSAQGGGSNKQQRKRTLDSTALLRRISTVRGQSIYGYHATREEAFLKLEVTMPHVLRALHAVLSGCTLGAGATPTVTAGGRTECFHSNIDPTQQFMVDVGLGGCQWCAEGADQADQAEDDDDDDAYGDDERRTRCAREVRIPLGRLRVLADDDTVAPLRLLSFDLEAAGRRGVFPQASADPVIQIALQFEVMGASSALRPVLLSLKECDAIEGADVLAFEDEAELLRCFADLVVAFDADVFTGYNILNFDFPYLHDRAAALSGVPPRPEGFPARLDVDVWDAPRLLPLAVQHFDGIGRLRGAQLRLRETEYQSAQTGKRKRTQVIIPGRCCIDALLAIQNTHTRLEGYKLDQVAEKFLGDRKEDVPFTQITPMWMEGPAGRRTLGVYCLKDAWLPLALNTKLDLLMGILEMARATGILLDAVLQRGVMVRNKSLLLRFALKRRLFFPHLPEAAPAAAAVGVVGRQQRYTGATVLDPIEGMHSYVGVLDFSAMYPSIIRAHNLCYSTIVLDSGSLLTANAHRSLRTPFHEEARGLLHVCGHTFVSEAYVRGLIPEVVEHLQQCRARAAKAAKETMDPTLKQVYTARALAFKIAGNGVYGTLGSTLSFLPLMAIAEAITALGRADILMVKRMAEEMYPDGLVVYGDTDSVFVRLMLALCELSTIEAVHRATELSVALAERVNACLKAPKKIEFEKVFSTMLLLSKKRYAGLMYKAGFKFGEQEPEIDVKGLQSVRRDGSPLVRNLVRAVIESILGTGSEVEAAALVRQRLLDITHDRVPYLEYAIRKTLRKAMHDCCHPMRADELRAIREQLGLPSSSSTDPLTYAEQDQAIMAKIPLPWRIRVSLAHVLLAWRLRLKDPGSAPVPGETISYLLTCNGGAKCCEKVETLEAVLEQKLPVDRVYYLNSLRTPMNNIFLPIFMQRLRAAADEPTTKKKRSAAAIATDHKELMRRAQQHVDVLLWNIIRNQPLREDAEKRRASVAASPLARAFAMTQAPKK